MKIYLLLIPILIMAIFQATFLPLNLVLILILVLTGLKPSRQSLWLAFFAGLILDLTTSRFLGISSCLFLVVSCLLLVYSRRFDAGQPIFLGLIAFLASLVEDFLIKSQINWFSSISLAIFTLLSAFLLRLVFIRSEKQVIRLKT